MPAAVRNQSKDQTLSDLDFVWSLESPSVYLRFTFIVSTPKEWYPISSPFYNNLDAIFGCDMEAADREITLVLSGASGSDPGQALHLTATSLEIQSIKYHRLGMRSLTLKDPDLVDQAWIFRL